MAGKIFGPNDQCLTPSHANKKGRRYRYYIEPPNTDRSNPNSRPLRLAANEIEKIVIDALKGLLKAPAKIIGAIGIDEPSPGSLQQINNGASSLLKALGNHRQTHELVRAVITRVDVAANAVSMEIDYAAFRHALDPSLHATGHRNYTLTVPATLKRLGAELKFIIDDDAAALPRQPDPSLVKAILQARRWWQLWLNGQGKSLKEISKSEGVNDRYISRLLPLAFLAPDITSMILDGRQPHDLTAERLIKHTKLPPDWTAQRRMLIARPIG